MQKFKSFLVSYTIYLICFILNDLIWYHSPIPHMITVGVISGFIVCAIAFLLKKNGGLHTKNDGLITKVLS